MKTTCEITEKISDIYKGGILFCILLVELGDHLTRQVHSLYRLHLDALTINVHFVTYIKMSVSVCRHYRNLRKT